MLAPNDIHILRRTQLKGVCVPLLANARLNSRTTPKALSLLASLSTILLRAQSQELDLKPALVSYAFFPLSSLLSQNDAQNVPDRVLEAVFKVMEILFGWWWWACDEQVWTQVVMLTGSVLGVGAGEKGKTRERSDETKDAAVRLLLCLLRDRSSTPGPNRDEASAKARFADLHLHAQSERVVPILGQILNTLLETSSVSEYLPLQSASLEAVQALVELYVPQAVMPTILPGVVSTMARVALGQPRENGKGKSKGGWVNGEIVTSALKVLDVAIVRAIGDEICLRAGIVKEITSLEDLADLISDASSSSSTIDTDARKDDSKSKVYETPLSQSYLRATASQLLVALNTTLPTLLAHPKVTVLLSLSTLSTSLLLKNRLTLPNVRPLLIGALLTLSNNPFPSVSQNATGGLVSLLGPDCPTRLGVLQGIMQIANDALSSLPQLIPARSDSQIIHVAGQVEAICRLGSIDPSVAGGRPGHDSVAAIRIGVSKLLGPTGGIEKWGWRLLSSLHFESPQSFVAEHGVLLLESDAASTGSKAVFPQPKMDDITSLEAQKALERMLRALGRTAHDWALFSVEWLVNVGSRSRKEESLAALWCACRVLEGIVNVDLSEEPRSTKFRRRARSMEKFARWLGRKVSDFWDDEYEAEEIEATGQKEHNESQSNEVLDTGEDRPIYEFVKGREPLETRFDILSAKGPAVFDGNASKRQLLNTEEQLTLHKTFALQLLSLSSTILESRVTPLLIHALYPILQSLVMQSTFLSMTAFATLQHISNSAGYASPGNLLLSNFDYALDGAARRLTKRRLDPEAPRVLVVLVRLVGKDVVDRAGDVVEECFDRLDEFHGYTVIVEGLIEVLLEVVRVVETEMDILPVPAKPDKYAVPPPEGSDVVPDSKRMEMLLEWLEHRNDPHPVDEENYGPAPREALGKGKAKEMPSEEEEQEKRKLNEVEDVLADPPATATQALVSQIIARSLYFLTHGSPPIRSRVLSLLTRSVPVFAAHESSLLPVVNKAWPFIVNRLGDSETYVVSAAAGLIEALVTRHGAFMTSRVWDDVWPRFRTMLSNLDAADAQSALSRRSGVPVGTDSAYTHSHRLYRAMLRTMSAAVRGGVQTQDRRTWDVLLAFRRFLHSGAHPELQEAACLLYIAFGVKNPDAVWLVLVSSAVSDGVPILEHLKQERWDMKTNIVRIMDDIDK